MRFVGRGLPAQAGLSHDKKAIAVHFPIRALHPREVVIVSEAR